MAETQQHEPQGLGRDRQWVDPIDQFRAGDYTSEILSGTDNYVSGMYILSAIASNAIRERLTKVHVLNRETNPMVLVFRDGGIAGNIIGGPWTFAQLQDRTITQEELAGAYAVSGIYAVVISGTFSAGMMVTVGRVAEPDPTDVGGLLG